MSTWIKRLLMLMLIFTATIGTAGFVVGCEDEGPAEEAGEEVDEAVEEAGDQLEEATD